MKSSSNQNPSQDKVFVPFSEELLASAGSPLGELVPFQLEYRCVRLLDGTYEFNFEAPAPDLKNVQKIGHAA